MNHIIVAGRLGADPEVRFTSSGQKVTSFRLASNSRRAGKEDTIWWRVTLWGDQFDKMISYLKKGSAIIVMGELSKPEIFTDKEGRPQISLNITASNISFSPFGKSDRQEEKKQDQNMHQAGPSQQETYQGMMHQNEEPAFADDEIPF